MAIEERINCPHMPRCLRAAGIGTTKQPAAYSYEDLLQIRGVGKAIAADPTKIIAGDRGRPRAEQAHSDPRGRRREEESAYDLQ